MSNLATLAQVKEYAPQNTANIDPLIKGLLPRASNHIRAWLSRDLPVETFTNKRLHGNGASVMLLPAYPIVEITKLQLSPTSQELTASDGLTPGYLHDDTNVVLVGDAFPLGKLNVVASWKAGYRAEESVALSAGKLSATPTTGGHAAQDDRVTYANGDLLTKIASGTPSEGQYVFDDKTASYLFSSEDAGETVTMRYWYVPPSISLVCCELVVLKIKQRDNLGVSSRSLGNESISYDQKDLTPSMRAMLQPFRRVIPV